MRLAPIMALLVAFVTLGARAQEPQSRSSWERDTPIFRVSRGAAG